MLDGEAVRRVAGRNAIADPTQLPTEALTPAQQRLLDAATECFAARGFNGTTTRDIARTAGLSHAVLYVHHSSKEDALYAIARRGHEAVLGVTTAARDGAGHAPVDQLAAVIHDFVLWHAQEHTTARVINYELSALTREHHAHILELRHRIEAIPREIVEAGVADGSFATTRPAATALATLSLGVDVGRWFQDDRARPAEDIAEHYRELALRMVGAAPTQPNQSMRRRLRA